MMGLEDQGRKSTQNGATEMTDSRDESGIKRKRGIDEDDMLNNAREERVKARKAIDEEKVKTYPTTNSGDKLTIS